MNEEKEKEIKSFIFETFSILEKKPAPSADVPSPEQNLQPEGTAASGTECPAREAAPSAPLPAALPAREAEEDKPADVTASKAEPVFASQPADAPAPALPVSAAPPKPVKPLPDAGVLKHTASLWKYRPVPDTEPEPSPEYRRIEDEYPGSTVIAARVRGKKHKHEGTNCDDWFETACFEDVTFIAVSDGAGSKRFSRIGAKASCKAAVGFLVRTFSAVLAGKPSLREDLGLPMTDARCAAAYTVLARMVQQSVVKAYEAVEAAYYSRVTDPAFRAVLGRDLELKDFSGTLLIAMVVPVDAGAKENLIVTCQVGDGMIAVMNTAGPFAGSLKLMGEPDSGDFSGETDFLTSPKMHQIETLQARTKVSRSVFDLVMVMTDGVADDYFPNETALRQLYFDLIANGILDAKGPDVDLNSLDERQLQLFKRMPDPSAYPWVNDQSVKIPLYYTGRICLELSLTSEAVWNDPLALKLAWKLMGGRMKNASRSERLEIWLDNYVQRGSFDDRTLVIAKL